VTHRLVDIPFSFLHYALLIFFPRTKKTIVIIVVLFFCYSFLYFFLLLLLARCISISTHFLYFFFQVLQFLFVVKIMKKKSYLFIFIFLKKTQKTYLELLLYACSFVFFSFFSCLLITRISSDDHILCLFIF